MEDRIAQLEARVRRLLWTVVVVALVAAASVVLALRPHPPTLPDVATWRIGSSESVTISGEGISLSSSGNKTTINARSVAFDDGRRTSSLTPEGVHFHSDKYHSGLGYGGMSIDGPTGGIEIKAVESGPQIALDLFDPVAPDTTPHVHSNLILKADGENALIVAHAPGGERTFAAVGTQN